MQIRYDKQSDSKYILIKKGITCSTQPLENKEWLLVDYDERGDILGLEILDASTNEVGIQIEGENMLVFELEKKNVGGMENMYWQGKLPSSGIDLPKVDLQFAF